MASSSTLHTATNSIKENDDGTFSLTLGDGTTRDGGQAPGRLRTAPRPGRLGLESVGVGPDGKRAPAHATDTSGLVESPASDGTSGPWLYAVGRRRRQGTS